jgi:hypothetical protein
MEFVLGQTVYLDADPQSDCAILLLFSCSGDHMEARRLILRGAPFMITYDVLVGVTVRYDSSGRKIDRKMH